MRFEQTPHQRKLDWHAFELKASRTNSDQLFCTRLRTPETKLLSLA